MERRDPEGADAFAQTVAPTSDVDAAAPPEDTIAAPISAEGSRQPASGPPKSGRGSVSRQLSESATIDPNAPAAETPIDLGALPEVDTDHYIAEHEVARGGMGRIVAARDRRL